MEPFNFKNVFSILTKIEVQFIQSSSSRQLWARKFGYGREKETISYGDEAMNEQDSSKQS
jgi:hypothetical protein